MQVTFSSVASMVNCCFCYSVLTATVEFINSGKYILLLNSATEIMSLLAHLTISDHETHEYPIWHS